MDEEKIRVLFGIVGLMISIFSIGVSISFGVAAYAFYGIGFGLFVFGYGLSPKFLLSNITQNGKAFSKTSSNIILFGCSIMILGGLIEHVL